MTLTVQRHRGDVYEATDERGNASEYQLVTLARAQAQGSTIIWPSSTFPDGPPSSYANYVRAFNEPHAVTNPGGTRDST